jgi:hypothetical protein
MTAPVLPTLPQVYRELQHMPAVTATLVADKAMQHIGLQPDDPQYAESHEQYRQAAGKWLARKFDPLVQRSRR